jgi:hypothetical protein
MQSINDRTAERRWATADIRLGTPGALCTLHVAGHVVGLVRRGGRQYSVVSVTEGRESRAAVCKSYALARAVLVGLVPAQGVPE